MIPNVRPGSYTLYAFTTGAVGEFEKSSIQVNPEQTASLGDLAWEVPHYGRIAWEIGVPDRTASEFAHGRDYFHGFVWKGFTKEFSNPLEFTIGKSDPAKDWNYAQSGYGDDKLKPWKWRIHFQLDSAPKADAQLALAIASAEGPRIEIYANDESAPITTVKPALQGGNALLRESILAKYDVERVIIPAAHLHAGKNVITLVQANVKAPGYHVMYDYLNLEVLDHEKSK